MLETFNVKLVHCGNSNIAIPEDNEPKNIFYIPMGVFALAKELNNNNFGVEIINTDLEINKEIDSIVKEKDESGNEISVDAIGLDCHWVNQSFVVMSAAKLFKKINPDIFIFLGGYTASLFANEIVDNYEFIDGVVRGDGEVPIIELCNTLKEFKYKKNDAIELNLNKVQNLVWRKNNKTDVNGFTYVAGIKQLEGLDFAQVDLLRNWKQYREFSNFFTKFSPLNILSKFFLCIGRGCVFNCTFCGGNSEAQLNMSNRRGQIVRPVKSVIETIRKVSNYGYKYFYTCFDFEGCNEWYTELFQAIKKEEIRIAFGYGCYKLPSKQLTDILSETCTDVKIELSPETGVELLRMKNKDSRIYYSNQELLDCLEYIGTKNNIKVQLYFGYFLPFDNADSVYETLQFIMILFSKFNTFIECIYGNLSTDPGSLLYYNPVKYNVDIKPRSFSDYLTSLQERINKKNVSPDMTLFKPTDMSKAEFESLSGKIRIFNYLFILFSESLNYLIKMNNASEILLTYLKNFDTSEVTEEDLEIENLKELLFDIGGEIFKMTPAFFDLVNSDFKNSSLINFRLKADI